MPTCEICGRECKSIREISLEGACLQACNRCAQLGEPVQRPKKPNLQTRSMAKPRSSSNRYRSARPSFQRRELVPVEDFTKLIRKAREQRKWSQKEVANKLHERTSVITKVESGKMAPTISLARKLERLYKLTLLEEAESIDLSPAPSLSTTTLGDVVQIKRKKPSP
jgi:putative transcription factor